MKEGFSGAGNSMTDVGAPIVTPEAADPYAHLTDGPYKYFPDKKAILYQAQGLVMGIEAGEKERDELLTFLDSDPEIDELLSTPHPGLHNDKHDVVSPLAYFRIQAINALGHEGNVIRKTHPMMKR